MTGHHEPQLSAKWADLGVRTASALVLVPVVFLDVWYGGVWFRLFAAFLGVLIAHEWCNIAHPQSSSQFAFHALAAMCAAFIPDVAGARVALFWIAAIWGIAVLFCAMRGGDKSFWRYTGVLYASLPVLALVMLRDDGELGMLAFVYLMLIVWGADIFAYFVGRIVGGPKLAPRLSPKKTWAGLLGAAGGSMLVAYIFARTYSALAGTPEGQLSALPLVVIAGVLAVIEQGGDIFESAFKRQYGVKDSGTLIPGHGGVMDRLDGLIFVSVVAVVIGMLRAGADDPARGLLIW
jgi:phosphatidate cytidylyltransferase